MDNKMIRIAIDGPAAAGKSTVARKVANRLSFIYVDTGAMYRALTLKVINENIPVENEQAIFNLLQETSIELIQSKKGQTVLLDGIDVTEAIRSHEVNRIVSKIAQIDGVRRDMVRRQQMLAENKSIVMDGRDIGTHVLPNAELKIFLIASVEERAERRHKENKLKGIPSNYEQVVNEIRARDELDYNRTISPLVKAEDAIEIDTTSFTINEVVDAILKEVNKLNGGSL